MICDPPYSEATHRQQPGTVAKGRRSRIPFPPSSVAEYELLAAACRRAQVRRWVQVFTDDRGLGALISAMAREGFAHLRTFYWIKPDAAPQFTGDRPACHVELVGCFHSESMRPRWRGKGQPNYLECGIARGEERWCSTPKPLAFMCALLELFTNPGELVIDPYGGGATTLVAAYRTGRRCVSYEIDADQYERSSLRVAEEHRSIPLPFNREKITRRGRPAPPPVGDLPLNVVPLRGARS